jgi:glutamate 5-kinase
LGAIPIINENDTVVTDEIKFGDNDTLAALVANLVEADCLIILTDIDGLFETDPRKNPDAKLVGMAKASNPELEKMAGGSGTALGKGGMLTKVLAAKRAARSGAETVIASGLEANVLWRLVNGEALGTHLCADTTPLAARKQWLANHLQIAGRVYVDQGATEALKINGKSLLPIGVTGVEGKFEKGAVVACIAPNGAEVARGLINYSASETQQIAGKTSSELESILGYVDEPELIHRDNLVLA